MNGEGKEGKHFEEENIFIVGVQKKGEGNGEKYLEKEMSPWWDEEQTTNKERQGYSAKELLKSEMIKKCGLPNHCLASYLFFY